MPVEKSIAQSNSRRTFIQQTAFASLALCFSGKTVLGRSLMSPFIGPDSNFKGVQVGVITYSFRSMPGHVENLIKYCVDAGISAIELMGDAVEDFAGKPPYPVNRVFGQPQPTLTEEQKKLVAEYPKLLADWRASVNISKFEEVRKMFKQAGISIYAFKPSALEPKNTDAEIEYALKVAKILGAKSVTVELPKDAAHSQRLGDLGAKHKVYIGYHAHTQATDTAWDVALGQSPYNSMNLDCGHYIAAGGSNNKETLLALIEAKHDRITSMHIKDRKSKANGGNNVVWGSGDTPVKEILSLLRDKKFKIPATIELEYDIPAGSDAVQETKKCVEFAKQALS